MRKTIFAAIAAAVALTGSFANAATIASVDGTDYEIELITGTFADNQALLESQIFFGNGPLASQLAGVIFNSLGTPNSIFGQPIGPLFVTTLSGTTIFAAAFSGGAFNNTIQGPNYQTNQSLTFATVTNPASVSAVPLPATALLLMSTGLGLGALKRRTSKKAA